MLISNICSFPFCSCSHTIVHKLVSFSRMPQVPTTISSPSDPNRIQHLLLFLEVSSVFVVSILLASLIPMIFLKHISDDKLVCFGFSSKCFKFQGLSVCVVPVFYFRYKRENGIKFLNYFRIFFH